MPAPLRHALVGHDVATAYEGGWHTLQNGELLSAAEAEGFELLLTADQNLRYQQNLGSRHVAVLALMRTDWRLLRQQTDFVVAAVAASVPGSYVELPIPPLSVPAHRDNA
jgi:hypothetical protein